MKNVLKEMERKVIVSRGLIVNLVVLVALAILSVKTGHALVSAQPSPQLDYLKAAIAYKFHSVAHI